VPVISTFCPTRAVKSASRPSSLKVRAARLELEVPAALPAAGLFDIALVSMNLAAVPVAPAEPVVPTACAAPASIQPVKVIFSAAAGLDGF